MRRSPLPGLLVLALAFAAPVPVAGALPIGGTTLLDRPSGSGPLPFDGIASTSVGTDSLTPDGHFVVFSSASNALLTGDEDSATNVYRLDLTTGALLQVDTTASGGQPTPGSFSTEASISADGNHVGFMTDSPALAQGASPDQQEFVVKNLMTGMLEPATVANGASGAAVANVQFAELSGDGRHVVFTAESSFTTDNVPAVVGSTSTTDAYERSLDANTTHMVSVMDPGGAEGGGVRDEPDIDFGGDAVAFSTITGLVPGDNDARDDAYFHTVGGTEHTVLASFSVLQTAGADAGDDVAIAGGPAGLKLAWSTSSSEWVAPCTQTACSPAAQADHARTGGQDNEGNEAPFFPPEPNGATLPTRVYWDSRGALDPADTNNGFDLYGWDIGNNNFDASIHLMTGGTATGGVFGAAATNDGAVTVFEGSGPTLPGSNGLVEQAYIRRAGTDINIGQQPFGGPTRTSAAGFSFVSPLHATSDDGGLAAFVSDAPAFGSPILPEGPGEQVLVRNVASGETRLVSAAPDGTAGNGDSGQPSVDAAGDRVAFESSATNLVPGDTNDAEDVFVRNLSSGATTLVDRTDGGGVPLDGAFGPEISADGTKVVFVSDSVDIPGAPPDSKDHIYEVDLGTGDVTLIDRATGGAPANDGSSEPDVDGDGGRVAFVSESSNLGGGTDESVYVRDLTNPASPTTTWVSTPQDANPAHDRGFSPSIDSDGGRIAFVEENANFGFGIIGREQVFVRDLGAHLTTLASAGPSGPASTNAGEPSLSADGSRVAFTSDAPELPGALPNHPDVFVRDLGAGTTVLASARDGGGGAGRFGAGGGGDSGSLSGNGACVAFDSNSDDLVSGGYGPDFQHSFLHALSAACPAAGTQPDKTPPVISHFSVTHKRFADGSKRTAVSAAKRRKPKSIPRGTTFKFRLSEAASVRIAVTEKVKGHRARKHAPCRAARRGQKRNCTRSVTLVTLVRAQVTAGANSVAFTGRFGSKRLRPGAYTATITATDPAGNRSKSHSLRFTVVRP